MHSPSGTHGSVVPSSFVPPFIFGEDDSAFRDAQGHIGDLRRLRHNMQTFSSLDVDDVLSIKLQDMVTGDSHHYTESEFPHQTGRVLGSHNDVRHHGSVLYHHTSPGQVVTSRNSRSVKRRPRSRRDARTSCYEVLSSHSGGGGGGGGSDSIGSLDSTQLLPDAMGIPTSLLQNGSRSEFGVSLSDQQQPNNSNYLDFLLHSEASTLPSSQVFSPELPSFLANSHQWEKLPMLYSEDTSIHHHDQCGNKADSDSCSPDSVISGFAGDVFDSLEPLCPAPSEWWVARLT